MRKFVISAVIVLAAMLVVWAGPPEESGEAKWFDMENCMFCKHLTTEPHLLENVTWEHHDISNGALSITSVSPEYQEAYQTAMKQMQDVSAKLASGEMEPTAVKMCGHCQSLGMLINLGVKTEYVDGEAADIMLLTSDEPETVKKIQQFAQRNRDELAKMAATEEPED